MVAERGMSPNDVLLPAFTVIEGGQKSADNQRNGAALDSLIAEIREAYRQRQDLLKTEISIRNRIWAIHDRMNTPPDVRAARSQADWAKAKSVTIKTPQSEAAAMPHERSADMLAEDRKLIEKRLERMATQLPVWPWVLSVRGFGALSLAKIIGETGDLSNYSNPSKVWKRMGLGVMQDGTRQRRIAGAEALEHGYSPPRRSLMYVIGDVMVKSNRDGVYRTLYLDRKEIERERFPDLPKMAHHMKAQRYMEKRLLRDLWRAWRDTA